MLPLLSLPSTGPLSALVMRELRVANLWGEKAGRGRGRGRDYRVRDGVGWMRGVLAADPTSTA